MSPSPDPSCPSSCLDQQGPRHSPSLCPRPSPHADGTQKLVAVPWGLGAVEGVRGSGLLVLDLLVLLGPEQVTQPHPGFKDGGTDSSSSWKET